MSHQSDQFHTPMEFQGCNFQFPCNTLQERIMSFLKYNNIFKNRCTNQTLFWKVFGNGNQEFGKKFELSKIPIVQIGWNRGGKYIRFRFYVVLFRPEFISSDQEPSRWWAVNSKEGAHFFLGFKLLCMRSSIPTLYNTKLYIHVLYIYYI